MPARAAYSHSASVGRRTRLPLLREAQPTKAFASPYDHENDGMLVGLREARIAPGELLLLDEDGPPCRRRGRLRPAGAAGLALLGVGHVARVGDELRELPARDRELSDPEVLRDRDVVRGLLVLLVADLGRRRALRERPVRDPSRLERRTAEIENHVVRGGGSSSVGAGLPAEPGDRDRKDEHGQARTARKAQKRGRGSHSDRFTRHERAPRPLSAAPHASMLQLMAKKLTLEEHADTDPWRPEGPAPERPCSQHAVEAGYLAARADGEVDKAEREILTKAVEMLSQGAVIEWETEQPPRRVQTRAEKDGAEARATKVGEALKELGQAEAGLLVAAFVARATNGVEKSEAEVLKAIGKAAGLIADKVRRHREARLLAHERVSRTRGGSDGAPARPLRRSDARPRSRRSAGVTRAVFASDANLLARG